MKRKISLLIAFVLLMSVVTSAIVFNTSADDLSENLLVNFDFENTADPYKDATGTHTLSFTNGTNGVYENGMLKTSGDGKLFMSLNSTFLTGVTDQLTVVMKMKMDTSANFFLRWCDASGAQLYRAKLEATGMNTSVDPATGSATWNKKTDIVTETGKWYYIAISFADSEAGVVETLNVMAENGDTVMSGTHTWAGSKMTVAALAAAKQWLQIGRYDVTYLDDFRAYSKAFTATDAKNVFDAIAADDAPATAPDTTTEPGGEPVEPGALTPIINFDFENADNPNKDASGAYTMNFTNGTNGVYENGILKTSGDSKLFISLNDKILTNVDGEMTIVMKIKMDTIQNFFFRWFDPNTNSEIYRMKFELTGMTSSVGTTWHKTASITPSAKTWYYVAASLKDSAAGIIETLNVMAADGTVVMTGSNVWTDATFTVAELADKQWFQIGRYDVTYLDDFRIYAQAFDAATAKTVFDELAADDPAVNPPVDPGTTPEPPTSAPEPPTTPEPPTSAPEPPTTPEPPTSAPEPPTTPEPPTSAPEPPTTPEPPTSAPEPPTTPEPEQTTAEPPAQTPNDTNNSNTPSDDADDSNAAVVWIAVIGGVLVIGAAVLFIFKKKG